MTATLGSNPEPGPQPNPDSELIPVLDLSGLTAGDPDAIDTLGAELRSALENVGFFFVTNHGVPWEQVQEIYHQAQTVHSVDPASLDNAKMDRTHGGYLGYAGGTSYASDIAGDVRTPNLNAAFFVHRGGYRLGNRWPDIDGFRSAVDTYMDSMLALTTRMLPVLAASLELDKDYFEPHFDDPSCTLRLSHYPPVTYGENDWGLAPHTDSTIITLLPANDIPGLEIRPAGHDWIVPPKLPESFLINSGDMLKRWTNNRFRSTAHRVRNQSNGDRYAIPFFYGTRDDAVIEALPTCIGPNNPPKHDPITYGDYQRWFINRNYAGVTGQTVGEAP